MKRGRRLAAESPVNDTLAKLSDMVRLSYHLTYRQSCRRVCCLEEA